MLFVVSRIAIVHFRSEKIQDQVSQKSPQRKTILARYNWFLENGCVSHRGPGQCRSCVADETIKNVPQIFVVRSPRKSTKRDSLELNIPRTTIWKILEKRLLCQPYSLQLVQALSDGDKHNNMRFVVKCLTKWKTKMIT